LDGGDHHLRVGVDPAGVQVLDDIGVGESVGGARRVKVLEFLQRLIAQVVAIDQKEDAAGAGLLDEAVGEGAGREGLPGAGGELDERPRLVLGERFFQPLDCLDLTVAQAGDVKRRHFAQAATQGLGLLQPLPQRFRAVKGEETTRTRLGIAQVAKERLVPRALEAIDKDVVPAGEVWRQRANVLRRLLSHTA
jgi:hypothetical protein